MRHVLPSRCGLDQTKVPQPEQLFTPLLRVTHTCSPAPGYTAEGSKGKDNGQVGHWKQVPDPSGKALTLSPRPSETP